MTNRRAPIGALLAVVVFGCFSPVLRNGFVGYDDPDYVTANPHVNTGLTASNLAWAFTSAHASNWHPLTWISHQLDVQVYGLWAPGHHLTSLLLHVASTVLLFWWLSGATGFVWRSAFVAAVFGLHPLHVESVAWVAERKDVLSTFFGLAALTIPGPGRLVLFACSLMAKPMLVTLPLLLLVMEWWLGKRVTWRDKVPLALLSAASCVVTLWAQRQGGSVAAVEQLPLALRLGNATLAYVRYLAKTVWPVKLAAFYPFPLHGSVALAAVVLVAITVGCVWRRELTAGWAWYAISLVPVIGIVQVGMQAMADRYMYVPMIGLAIAAAWGLARLRWAGVVPLVAFAVLSWQQIAVWKDGVTLWTHALAVTEDNFVAHDNLGVELDRLGRADEALAHYREALRIRPGDRNAEGNFAMASFAKGERLFEANQFDGAVAAFGEGLRYRPENAGAHLQTGVAYARLGKVADAGREFAESVRYDPANVQANYYLGVAMAAMGRRAEALRSFEAALKLKPDFAPAREARDEVAGKLRK